MTLEQPQKRERVPNLPDALLNSAIWIVAASCNQDLLNRVAETLADGGDGLGLLREADGSLDRVAIDMARAWQVGKVFTKTELEGSS